MPHDKNGNLVEVGDVVTIECKVKSVQPSEEFCNVECETVELMPPHDTRSTFNLSTKQVLKVVALIVLALGWGAASANAIEIIGGGAAGYCLGGPDAKATYFTATAGAMVKTFNDGWTKVYTVGRYNGTELNSQWGVKAILANKVTSSGLFWWIIDAGALDGGFINADGTDEITPSFGTGPTVVLSKYQSVSLYGECWRASATEWNRTLWLTTQFHIFE